MSTVPSMQIAPRTAPLNPLQRGLRRRRMPRHPAASSASAVGAAPPLSSDSPSRNASRAAFTAAGASSWGQWPASTSCTSTFGHASPSAAARPARHGADHASAQHAQQHLRQRCTTCCTQAPWLARNAISTRLRHVWPDKVICTVAAHAIGTGGKRTRETLNPAQWRQPVLAGRQKMLHNASLLRAAS